jgi:UDP-N-acetylglucosamine/UDP-N-acetylgalactosamine diphosphorylase
MQFQCAFSPPQNPSVPTQFLDGTRPNPELEEKGLDLLRENKVAILMAAGGISTRMGISDLRGNIPIGPVTQRSIFRLQGEKIAAIKQRYAPEISWLVMTSREVHDATVASFAKEEYFGVPPNKVWFFQQPSLPVLDERENPVILPDGTYLECPCGHGGMLEALQTSGVLRRLYDEGVKYLFYFQYPNILENVCDPVMLGYHHVGQFDVTTKAITEYLPEEKMGRCVDVDGNLRIIEYYHLKDVPSISCWDVFPANMATHVWGISFLMRCLRDKVSLPYYVVPYNALTHLLGKVAEGRI